MRKKGINKKSQLLHEKKSSKTVRKKEIPPWQDTYSDHQLNFIFW